MPGPLDGVRILDLTVNVMGPFASLQLADLGADVWKVEAPGGDAIRTVGPVRNRGMAANFLHLNRNKRSMVLDLKNPEGIAALRRMVADADVLMHSSRPAAMARLGLSYEDVAAINPRIIYVGAYGFGQNGPYADRPAYDDLIQAASGMTVLQARRTGPPENVATPIADRAVGIAAAMAVTTALFERERSGLGQEVQVPMYETFVQLVMSDHLGGLSFVPQQGDWGYARSLDPGRHPYRTADDGYIAVNMYNDKHWHAFFAATGHAEMITDARYADVHARIERQGELYAFLEREFPTKTTEEWMTMLVTADIPAIEVATPDTLVRDPHLDAVGFFDVGEHPTEGTVRSIGIPQTWSRTEPELRIPTPRLGEHTVELLEAAGFEQAEIIALLASGAAVAADGAGVPS
ncbi:CoA transferase [Tsukamurella sp. NPDC003166]|uniref:CaiB/BaiF CoA transferase family protein n=1 Tax=Tsukamurella sp. NPDC003166 TaxID=3154444 RepID=UPI0033B6580A